MIQIVFCLAKPAKIIDLVNDRSLGHQALNSVAGQVKEKKKKF